MWCQSRCTPSLSQSGSGGWSSVLPSSRKPSLMWALAPSLAHIEKRVSRETSARPAVGPSPASRQWRPPGSGAARTAPGSADSVSELGETRARHGWGLR